MADEPLSLEKARALMMPYWCALGEFLGHFAMTEMLLKLVIGKDTGLSVDATRILLQGTRANDVAGYSLGSMNLES